MNYPNLALGRYAEIPYIAPDAEVPVYCIEELCYVLKENAFLMSDKLCDMEMVRFIDTQLELPELAGELEKLLRKNGSPSALAGIILDYAGYGSVKERREMEQLLRESVDEEPLVKQKIHADYLYRHGKYAQALNEYAELLAHIPEDNVRLLSEVHQHLGVACCKIFNLEVAASNFHRSFMLNPGNTESIRMFLACKRLMMPEEAYIEFVSANPQWHDMSIQLEKEFGQAEQDYSHSREYLDTQTLRQQREQMNDKSYYDTVTVRLMEMKEAYRQSVNVITR